MSNNRPLSFTRKSEKPAYALHLCLLSLFIGYMVAQAQFVLAQTEASLESTKISFAAKKIRIGKQTLTVEIADNEPRRERGLMFRKSLAPGHGMLFVFDYDQPLAFWMKNTLIPLSIGFFDNNKKLINILEMQPSIMGELVPKTYSSARPARYALEMPKHWFREQGIRSGASFTFVENR